MSCCASQDAEVDSSQVLRPVRAVPCRQSDSSSQLSESTRMSALSQLASDSSESTRRSITVYGSIGFCELATKPANKPSSLPSAIPSRYSKRDFPNSLEHNGLRIEHVLFLLVVMLLLLLLVKRRSVDRLHVHQRSEDRCKSRVVMLRFLANEVVCVCVCV